MKSLTGLIKLTTLKAMWIIDTMWKECNTQTRLDYILVLTGCMVYRPIILKLSILIAFPSFRHIVMIRTIPTVICTLQMATWLLQLVLTWLRSSTFFIRKGMSSTSTCTWTIWLKKYNLKPVQYFQVGLDWLILSLRSPEVRLVFHLIPIWS